MNNLFLQPPPHSNDNYWNPLQLVTSPTLKKTSSYETLSLEDKVLRLEKDIKQIQNSNIVIGESKNIFFKRIMNLLNENESEELNYLKEFYEESPNFKENNDLLSMINNLSWLSYNDKIKKNILDEDIINYFIN
tara:strand:- start:1708 stop:2109 length:402 start_codon:yes stop_codon:yes gene_type:complete